MSNNFYTSSIRRNTPADQSTMLSAVFLLPLLVLSAMANTTCKKPLRPLDSAEVRRIFAPMATGNSSGFFTSTVVPNVDWTVTNPDPLYATMPLSGHFNKLSGSL